MLVISTKGFYVNIKINQKAYKLSKRFFIHFDTLIDQIDESDTVIVFRNL